MIKISHLAIDST